MIKVLTAEEMRSLDRKTIEEVGIPGIVLMERAAQGCVEVILESLDENSDPLIYVFCGKGNNGGDGLAIARYLAEEGLNVEIVGMIPPDEYKGDAAINAGICQYYRIPWTVIGKAEDLYALNPPDIIIDALFGTGFQGKLEGLPLAVVEYINQTDAFVLSVDIPSGLNADSPLVKGEAVVADITVTMAAPKRAHLFYPARSHVGELKIAPIGIPLKIMMDPQYRVSLVEKNDIVLPYRSDDAYKYRFGKVLVIGGSTGLIGAPVMAARAATISGAGMVHVAVPESVYPVVASGMLGEICRSIPDGNKGWLSEESFPKIKEEWEWADVILVGPGLGRKPETADLLKKLLALPCKTVILDADALILLADDPELWGNHRVILTPHYAEFARLTGLAVEEIKSDPVTIAQEFSTNHQVYCNLKNAPSLLAAPDGRVFINSTGNASLAKGGSGDVLAGMIAGFCAIGMDKSGAVMAANFIHGYAADRYAEKFGYHSLTMERLLETLPMVLGEFE